MYAVVFRAHQKLDRVAYRHLKSLLPEGSFFPSLKEIIYFEGHNGPDATKLKQPGTSEQPWHFVDPLDVSDTDLHGLIANHYEQLVVALRAKDRVRAAFEAAWLAHSMVDGLTPAHHYPYESALSELRGEDRQTRKGLVGRGYVKGENIIDSVARSLKLIGPKGLLTTHALFEAGAYAIIAPLTLNRALPSPKDIERVNADGVVGLFKKLAEEVADLRIYDRYYAHGWTQGLSRDIRSELAPRMVRLTTLAWFTAVNEARS
jgi:hypothetical protein